MSRTTARLLLAATAALALGKQAGAQSPQVLYQQALRMEQVQGDLESAMALFRRVVAAGDRALAARALVHIGRSYERLGKPGAEAPYQRVLAVYPDQAGSVERARARLTVLGRRNGGATSSSAAAVVVRLVAAAEDLDRVGQVSPDGRLITTVGGASGGGWNINVIEADLVVHDLATGGRRRVTRKTVLDEGAGKAIWSPTGSRIAYAWTIADHTTELRAIDFDGTDLATLFRDPEVPDLQPEAWSADGRQVLTLLRRRDQTTQLALVPVEGGAPRVLVTFRDSLPTGVGAGFSPDQRWIAYGARSGRARGDHDLFGLSFEDNRTITLVDHPAEDRFLGWAAGGILFTSDRRGTTDLFLLPMRDAGPAGPPVLLKTGIGPITPAGFDRRGALYYHSEVSISDLYTTAVDPATWRAVGEVTLETGTVEGKNSHPDWSPDGEYFGYLSLLGAGETPTVVVRREPTGEERRIELPVGLDPFVLRVAPGGARALVAGFQGGGRVVLANLLEGTYQALLLSEDESNEQSAAWTPGYAWSPDGRRVFYTTFGGGGRLMARDLTTGQDRELYRAAGGGAVRWPVLSPDGRLLAFAVHDGGLLGPSAVVVMSTDGGATRELGRRDRGRLTPIAFTPDGRQVIYHLRRVPPEDNPPLVLYRVPVAGGDPELLELPAQRGPMRFRPDGRRVAFARDHTLNEIWVLEDFTRPRPPGQQ
jgi:Tol biopolymer transport system component